VIPISKKGKELQDIVAGEVVWDNHACMPLRHDDEQFLPQLAHCRASGIDVVTLNVGYGSSNIE